MVEVLDVLLLLEVHDDEYDDVVETVRTVEKSLLFISKCFNDELSTQLDDKVEMVD